MINRIELADIIGNENVKENEPMAAHTTFRIGGAARWFLTPSDVEQFEKLVLFLRKRKEPFFVLGNGSNLLVPDDGYDGVIIATHPAGIKEEENGEFGLSEYREVSEEELIGLLKKYTDGELSLAIKDSSKVIVAGSGILLSALAAAVSQKSLKGFEFASGIPGTLGGAVTMNAGAYGGEIRDCIEGAVVLLEDGKKRYLSKEELDLGYRSSRIQKENMIVLMAVFAFQPGDKEEILETMRDFNQRRRDKQPLNYGSAGSTFKRPEGYFAGKLVEDAGLKGYRVGDVMVSEKHAGFVVNVGNGTFKQAMAVISHVRQCVKEKYDVELEMEVKILTVP